MGGVTAACKPDHSYLRIKVHLEASSVTGSAKTWLDFAGEAGSSWPRDEVSIAVFSHGRADRDNGLTRALDYALDVISERHTFDFDVHRLLRAILEWHQHWTKAVEPALSRTDNACLPRRAGWIAFHHDYAATTLRVKRYNQLDRTEVPDQEPRMSSFCPPVLKSLDDSLALLCESLGNLKAAKSVNIAEAIEQLKMAAESAQTVREFLSSELPEASWQNRQELDALVEKVQQSLRARTLGQLRSRLLALATELERGSIVHRRAHRVNELNQLRDQAINELRSRAALEGAPQNLPGPPADQWIAWACSLKEPQDAESLQTLRNRFAHLDDFVANLEPNMWIAAGSPILETLNQPQEVAASGEISAVQSEVPVLADDLVIPPAEPFPQVAAPHFPLMDDVLKQIELEEAKSSGDKPRLPDLLDEPSLPELESNTPTTNNDVAPAQTEEEIQRTLARERALLDSMMGLDNGPARHLNTGAERPWGGKWWALLATAAVLLVAALGAIQWRSHRNQADLHPSLPQVTPTYAPVKSPAPAAPELVQIKYFNVEPKLVEAGQRVTLSWEVMHAKEVWIKGLGPQPILVRPSGVQAFPVPRTAAQVVLEAEGEGANNSAIEVRPINFASSQAEHKLY